MKILLTHPRFEIYGGAEILLVKLINYLSKNNKITLLTSAMNQEIEKDIKD